MRKQSDKLKVVGLPNNWLEVFKTVDAIKTKRQRNHSILQETTDMGNQLDHVMFEHPGLRG